MTESIYTLEFVFENCETVIIPIDCFKCIDYKIENDTITYFNAKIVDNNNITFGLSCSNKQSPIQRIDQYNDITSIVFKYCNGDIKSYYVIWEENNDQYNPYQSTMLTNYREVEISICKNNLKYQISDMFAFPDGTQFIAENKKIYTVNTNRYGKYLACGEESKCDLEEKIYETTMNNEYIKL